MAIVKPLRNKLTSVESLLRPCTIILCVPIEKPCIIRFAQSWASETNRGAFPGAFEIP